MWVARCHAAGAIGSMLCKRGHGATTLTIPSLGQYFACRPQASVGSRSAVFWVLHRSDKSLESLQRASKLFGTVIGLPFATSFLAAAGQGAVQCDSHSGGYNGFQGSRQAPEITEFVADDSSELEPRQKLLDFIKRYWWPTVFLLTVVVGYPYPKSLLPNTLLLIWSTKPNPASIYLWLKKAQPAMAYQRRDSSQPGQGALDRMKDKLNSSATVMHVEVQDYMLFCLAKVTYLTSNATMVGVLGDWWIVYSSSSRITALGLDNVPNLDNLAKDFISKKEELEAEFKKVTEDGLKKYKTWIDKLRTVYGYNKKGFPAVWSSFLREHA